MNIKNRKQKRSFILSLVKIRRNIRRTPEFTDDVILTSRDFKDIIFKQKSIFKITSQTKARIKVKEILTSIKNHWEFTYKNNIDKNTLSCAELPNGNIQIVGYQTEILERYLDDYLFGREDNLTETVNLEIAKNIKIEGDNLVFELKKIPMERGQKTMTQLFLDSARIFRKGRLSKKGELLNLEDIQKASNYLNEEAFRDGLKKLRRKLKKSGWPVTIENPGTKKYQMLIQYIKKQK